MKKFNIDKIKNELIKYKHESFGQVKFSDVDSHKVVHNVQFFYYLEWARIQYFESIGMPYDNETFTEHDLVLIAHNEADYLNSLYLADKYKILTRTRRIGNSSITLDNIIIRENGDICVKATSTLVFLDSKENKSMRIPDKYRNNILELEGDSVEVVEK